MPDFGAHQHSAGRARSLLTRVLGNASGRLGRRPSHPCFPGRCGSLQRQAGAPAADDPRQHGPPELRLLLSPGSSERLARRCTDEWSSSVTGAPKMPTIASSCSAGAGVSRESSEAAAGVRRATRREVARSRTATMPATRQRRHSIRTVLAMEHLSGDELQAAIAQLDQAIYNHEQWYKNVQRVLIARLPPDAADLEPGAHHRCRFGQWYDSDGAALLGDHVAFAALGEAHKQMHGGAARILQRSADQLPISVSDLDQFNNLIDRMRLEIQSLRSELAEAAQNRDPLTGVRNRRARTAAHGDTGTAARAERADRAAHSPATRAADPRARAHRGPPGPRAHAHNPTRARCRPPVGATRADPTPRTRARPALHRALPADQYARSPRPRAPGRTQPKHTARTPARCPRRGACRTRRAQRSDQPIHQGALDGPRRTRGTGDQNARPGGCP